MSRKVTISLYHGDDFERMAELRREVEIAERKVDAARTNALTAAPTRLGDDDPDAVAEAERVAEERRDAFDAFVDEASDRAENWVLQPIGHRDFRDLLRKYPARKVDGEDGKKVDHPDDEGWGVNTDEFGQALLEFVDPGDPDNRTIVEPKFDTTEAMQKRLRRLAAGEFDSMWVTAHSLNDGAVRDPKAAKFSPVTRLSDET